MYLTDVDQDRVLKMGYESRERYRVESQLGLTVMDRDRGSIVGTKSRERESRAKPVWVPLNNVFRGSAVIHISLTPAEGHISLKI